MSGNTNKARARPNFRPSIVDVEASGFGAESYPIEIGIVLASGQRYSAVIKPVDSWQYWDADAQSVHGISRDMLAKHGKPVRQVAEDLNSLIGERTVYSDGWVVDAPWVDKLFYHALLPRSFRVSPLESILTEEQMAIWHTTKDDIVRVNDVGRHRASIDAMLIQETFVSTRQIVNGKGCKG